MACVTFVLQTSICALIGETVNELISSAAKTIFLYCRARTNSKEEAEDLSQDILFKLMRAKGSFINEKSFYGFMWAVAGNVYKNWYKKCKRHIECELDDHIPDGNASFTELFEQEEDISRLYRELGLLTEQYRRVTILYYFEAKKVSDISKSLGISESMVKFLLFKTRKILKEGMNMEKARGDLSFSPGRMWLGSNRPKDGSKKTDELIHEYWDLVNKNLIAQNILFACYNDRCSAEDISLQIGVAVPYLEMFLEQLHEKNLLVYEKGKYETNIVIFTREYYEESDAKTLPVQREVAGIIENLLIGRLGDIKNIGFHMGKPDDDFLKWHIVHMLSWESGRRFGESLNYAYPTKYTGEEALFFGTEQYENDRGGIANCLRLNDSGDYIMFTGFSINGRAEQYYFDLYPNRVNILFDIAKGKSGGFGENDSAEIAEFIKLGYVSKDGDKLILNFPVMTEGQYEEIKNLLEDAILALIKKKHEFVEISTDVLQQHVPPFMKKEAECICWVNERTSTAASVKMLVDSGVLRRKEENEHPTMFVVLTQR